MSKQKGNYGKKVISENDANKLVFLDECGVNTDMTRHYARAKSNERAADSTPVNTPCSTTILSSVRLNSQTAYTVYRGGTTAEQFAEYLKIPYYPHYQKMISLLWTICVHITQNR